MGNDYRSSVGGLLFTILDTDSDPLTVIAAIRDLRNDLHANERAAVEDARARGRTWQDIADALGITGEAAQERFA